MKIKLGDIEGLLPKRKVLDKDPVTWMDKLKYDRGFGSNETLDQISNIEVSVDEDKLLQLIQDVPGMRMVWEEEEIRDLIANNIKDIIRTVE